MTDPQGASIPESYFENRVQFTTPFWGVGKDPELFLQSLHSSLQKWKVGLKDISGNKEANTLADFRLTINIPELTAAVRVGMESAIFMAVNPDWSRAEAYVEMFETAMNCIQQTADVALELQDVFLSMHIVPGSRNFHKEVSRLVNTEALGNAEMYGISVYRHDQSLIIDKSLKYPGGVFVRMNRLLAGKVPFSEIAEIVYKDESDALSLIGMQDLMQE